MKCSICAGELVSIGTIPFGRNNENIPITNDTPIEYVRCTNCYSIFCPEILTWTPEQLGQKVYNEEYIKYDPSYIDERPKNYAEMFRVFPAISPRGITHLDYGSGSGAMVNYLKKWRWNSTCYDPYSNTTKPEGKFNFITAIEVVEHSLNIDETIVDMKKFLDLDKGLICFSTQFANKDHNIDWWYIGAIVGHISILSAEAMKIVATRHNLFLHSIHNGLHLLQPKRSNYRGLFQRKL